MHRGLASALAALSLLLIASTFPVDALAHESKKVGGKYQVEVGFLDEPPVVGQMNGLDLRVSIPSQDDKPVGGLEKTLKAAVIVGGDAKIMNLALEPREDLPGAYEARFIPTQEGSYIFHITGTIEGTPVDERFESGPGRFDDVQAAQPLQFPVKLPDGASLSEQLRSAQNEAATARLLAASGLLFGIVGFVTGGLALLMTRRGRRTSAPEDRAEGPESEAA